MSAPAEVLGGVRDNFRRYGVLLAVAAVVVAADQVSKDLALDRLSDSPVDLIHGWLSLRLTFNSGAAFGLGRQWPQVFLAVTLVVVAVILYLTPRVRSPALLVPLGMIVGGGLSNVGDRLFRANRGQVIDFIDVHHWPVFNLADSSIVVGVILVVLLSWTSPER